MAQGDQSRTTPATLVCVTRLATTPFWHFALCGVGVWVSIVLGTPTFASANERAASLSPPPHSRAAPGSVSTRPPVEQADPARFAGSRALQLAAPAPARLETTIDATLAADEMADTVRLTAALGTHLPLTVGGTLGVDLPLGWFAEAQLGMMPRGYVDVINDVTTSLDLYSDAVGELLSVALSGSIVLRTSLGVRPFGPSGLEVLVGYTGLNSGGGSTDEVTIERATGVTVPVSIDVPIEASLHAVHVAVGFRHLFDDHLFFQGRVGWVHTVSADAIVDVGDRAAISQQVELVVSDTLTSYGFSPELQLQAGYRF